LRRSWLQGGVSLAGIDGAGGFDITPGAISKYSAPIRMNGSHLDCRRAIMASVHRCIPTTEANSLSQKITSDLVLQRGQNKFVEYVIRQSTFLGLIVAARRNDNNEIKIWHNEEPLTAIAEAANDVLPTWQRG
jgi:CHAT domain-containing protein